MLLTKDIARQIIDLNPSGLVDRAIAERQFEVIVESFNHLYNGQNHIYIADEVGLGKTYIALGISSLLRHFSDTPNTFTDFIIVPKKNLQFKWQKEIRQFIMHNFLLADNRVKSVIGSPIGKITSEQIHEKFEPVHNSQAAYHTYRISSFSMGTHENFNWNDEFRFFPEYNEIFEKLNRKADESLFRRLYALLMNIYTPQIDCLIVDEAHNFKHGMIGQVSQRNEVVARFMGNKLEQDKDIFELFPEIEPKIRPLAKKVIFLSATPIDKGMYQLKNQLEIFLPYHKFNDLRPEELDETMKGELSEFLIRGVMNINLFNKDYSRNMYRYEHRNGNVSGDENAAPLRLNDDKLALITGLVQYKTMKHLSTKNNQSFEIGLLAGFESFNPRLKDQEQEFDDSGESRQNEAEDSNVIRQLADSYLQEFGKPMPHLKQDALVKELINLMLKGEKALVFVKRIASVVELEIKLLEDYSDYLFEIIEAFEKKNKSPRLQILIKAFREKNQRKEIEDIIKLVSQRINLTKFNQLFDPSKFFSKPSEIENLLTRLYDQPTEDVYWEKNKSELEQYQTLIQKHIGRKNRVDTELVDLCLHLLQTSLDRLINENDPDETIENEEQSFEEDITTPYFFEGFFKGKGKTFRKATYDNPWYEINLYLINREYQLFNINLDTLGRFHPDTENKKEANLFKGEQENYESMITDQPYEEYPITREYLLKDTFITRLLLNVCREEFNIWISEKRKSGKEHLIEAINSLVEILKGIFRNGSGLIPAYLAWTTTDFTTQLINLLNTDFKFVLNEVKTVITDFNRIVSTNFPDPFKIKYALYNQLPIQGVSGHHKVNVSKIAAQFRMPGYPYILIATDILKEGEDLHTYCTHIYHYGIAWNPSDMEQRTGRIDRIGSKCYYRLKEKQGESIPFDRKLQVFFPYLSDTLEVNQVARVFEGMNRFIDTFYDFTETTDHNAEVNIGEVVKGIPLQIITKLESKYDIQHFKKSDNLNGFLQPLQVIGFDKAQLQIKIRVINQYILDVHVDKHDEYSIVDSENLRIKGLIYNEKKGRQCPYKINVINGFEAGTFQYEIISPITNRRNLSRGAMKEIREKLSDENFFEMNSVLYAHDFIPVEATKENILKTFEKLVYLADELEEKYAKEDYNYLEG